MKISRIPFVLLVVAALLQVSCDKDFLNTQPLDKISSEATWRDGPLSEAFIFNVYSFLCYGGFCVSSRSFIADQE